MTEQSASPDSDSSTLARLAALESQPEAAADPEPAQESAPPEQDQTDYTDTLDEVAQDEAPAAEADLAEVFADDGEPLKVPAKLKDSFLRWQDYTKKTQEVSKLQEAAQDRLHFAEAREQLVGAILQDVAEHRALQKQLEQFQALDWQQLYNQDPGHTLKLRDQRDQLQQRLSSIQAQIAQKAQTHQSAANQHAEKQWLLAVEAAKARIGKFTAEEDAAMLNVVKDLGFSEKEMKTKLSDPRILHALHKAAKWDMLQKQKPGAVAAFSKAPPVVKPGASKGQGAVQIDKYKALRQEMRKTAGNQQANDRASLQLFRLLEQQRK